MATTTTSSKQPTAGGGEPKASSASAAASSFDWNAGDKCPIGESLSVLYEDNRRQVLDTLRRHPVTGNLLPDYDYDSEAMEEPDWRQRLVFADEELRGLVLRNVLREPTDDGVANVVGAAGAKKKDRRKRRQQQQVGDGKDGEVVPYPPRLGIVGTRVIRHDVTEGPGSGFGGAGAAAISLAGAMGVNVGTEGEAVLVNEAVEENEVRDDLADRTDLLIYYVRPNPADARMVAQKIRRYRDKFARASHHHHGGGPARQPHHRIVFLPQCTSVCERVLLDEGVLPLDVVSVSELHLDLIPLDRDVLSMELPDVLRECDVDGCPSAPVTAVARSIVKMQDLCGVIPRVQGLGPLASAVIEQAMSIRVQEHYEDGGAEGGSGGTGEEKKGDDGGAMMDDGTGQPRRDIDAMIVLDRKVDLVTPMLTPLTYEGLIDEVIGIEGGYIRIDESLMEPDGDEEGEKTGGEEAGKTEQRQQQASTNPFDDPSSEPATTAPPKPRKIALALNGSDTLYDEVRNQNVEKFGSFLQDQARALRESHGHFRTTKTKRDLTEIHHFVKQIPIFTQNLRSLTLHIHLAETLKRTTDGSDFRQRWHTERSMVEGETCYDALEDLVATGREPPYDFLRLLCLQSLTGGGLKSAKFDSLRREVVQTYGYGYLFVLNNLEKMGMLRRREGIMPVSTWVADAASTSSGGVLPYSSLRRLLTLINAEVNNVEPDDVSYVSSGYAPLAVRLVQAALSPRGWTGKEEVLRSLPGGLVDVVQRVDGDGVPEEMRQATRRGGPPPRPLAAEAASFASSSGNDQQQQRGGGGDTGTTATKKKPVLLIYFVGGVTYMEIAALRFLNGRPGFPFRILCCTTKVINGSTLLRSLS